MTPFGIGVIIGALTIAFGLVGLVLIFVFDGLETSSSYSNYSTY